MKLLIFVAMGFLMVISLFKPQSKPGGSDCLSPELEGSDVVLTICNHEYGMATQPQPRLFVRLHRDGRGEIETTRVAPPGDAYPGEAVIKREFKATADEVEDIRRLGRSSDFQDAKAAYPAYAVGTDTSVTSTVIFHDMGVSKTIKLVNFSPASADNKKHYGLSLTLLMARAIELHDRGVGIVREVPTFSFCELMKDREWYIGREVAINADLVYGSSQQYIGDRECADRSMGSLYATETVDVGFSSANGNSDALRDQALALREERFGGRARVYISGVLRAVDGGRARHRFDITEFKTIDPIFLPFHGRLESGRMYSDLVDQPTGREFKLSSPVKVPAHHAARIEWINEDKFPVILTFGRKYITFRVISADVRKMGSNRWNTIYVCQILNVKVAPFLD